MWYFSYEFFQLSGSAMSKQFLNDEFTTTMGFWKHIDVKNFKTIQFIIVYDNISEWVNRLWSYVMLNNNSIKFSSDFVNYVRNCETVRKFP